MKKQTNGLIWLWLTLLVIIFDQATKIWASSALEYHQPVPIIPFLNFTLLHNTGAAFSFLAQAGGWQRWFFTILAIAVSMVLIVWLKRLKREQRWLGASERRQRSFVSLEEFVRRTGLDEGTNCRLAEAGAFGGFGIERRAALWAIRGWARTPRTELDLATEVAEPSFATLGAFEEVDWDYRASRHSARGHPLETMRDGLRGCGLPDARTVQALQDGARVRYAGIVICRQRPGTASGVVFLTLEDETGFINVVCWAKVYERYKVLVKTTSFLGVSGVLQVKEGVVHLIADSFWVPRIRERPTSTGSRDFH